MKKQTGFTLIELVIVIVILGFLAVTALPKMIDLTDQAKKGNIQGMAGGFGSAVSLIRTQWEGEARPTVTGKNVINYDGVQLLLTTETSAGIRPGYVVDTYVSGATGTKDTLQTTFGVEQCINIWNNIFQQPPTIGSDLVNLDDNTDYYAKLANNPGVDTTCYYFLKQTLEKGSDDNYVDPSIPTAASGGAPTVGNSFSYKPANSQIRIYINN